MIIKFTIQESPLGRLLIASTEKGICMVSLGDSDPNLAEALRERFSAAEFERNNAYFDKMMPAFLSYLTGQRPELDLPVDIGTTPFRLKVYEALKKIPYGKTCSYEEVAQAIGNPRAIRAVGSACANNPVALVIPCHRVVRKDGSLGGYRWGLKRKEKLLEMERRLTPM